MNRWIMSVSLAAIAAFAALSVVVFQNAEGTGASRSTPISGLSGASALQSGGAPSGDAPQSLAATLPSRLFLSVKGQKQGAIKGPETTKGWENTIGVHAASWSAASQRDPQSGLPTGRRTSKVFNVTVSMGAFIPQLYMAFDGNENLPEVVLSLVDTAPTGAPANYFTYKLTNANIASIDMTVTPDGPAYVMGLTFAKIELTVSPQ
ncbi:MAG: type VI secretion system tube protein Hcp [Chloroflexi bacterium]|nr:type VI secretion system tube protein Hcp [Chloroflexota bacterium]